MFGTEVAGETFQCDWDIFRADNYCLMLIMMDDYLQL